MASKTKIAIVGRPNVGKSALFNRICGRRIAIVDEAEGVTRDRLYAESECFGRNFQLIDTGGIDAHSKADFNDEIRRQAEIAIEEADSLIMVVDSVVGITDLDMELARILLRTNKPVCLAVNKVDSYTQQSRLHNFYGLGIEKMTAVSAVQGLHIAELLEMALKDVNDQGEEEEDPSIKVAIIGRPNVGKSTFVNALLEEERCVVSPIAGTTRDSIDVKFSIDDQEYTLIDTAGFKRKKSEADVIEKFARIRTQRAIERADICILMLDAKDGLTSQEKRIAQMIEEAGKGCILLFNKWDLVEGFRMEHCMRAIQDEVHFLRHCPKLFISALTGRNLSKVFSEVQTVHSFIDKRLGTPELNRFIQDTLQRNHPPMIDGKRLRIYYLTQVNQSPPRFLLFINYKDRMTKTYKRYLVNQFRERFQFSGLPVYFILKDKKETEAKKKSAAKREVISENYVSDLPEEALEDILL
ncbi:MAG: ribosome biogenesis GTPase Der [Waddliaceae bacterium]|nr:ribosome biogenesis GTPase Der [Waddliaceae bacterium]